MKSTKITNEKIQEIINKREKALEESAKDEYENVLTYISIIYAHLAKYIHLKHIQLYNIKSWTSSIANSINPIKEIRSRYIDTLTNQAIAMNEKRAKIKREAIGRIEEDNEYDDEFDKSLNKVIEEFNTIEKLTDKNKYIDYMKKNAYDNTVREKVENMLRQKIDPKESIEEDNILKKKKKKR